MTIQDSDQPLFSMAYSPDDKLLACGFGDGMIRIYNTSTGKMERTLVGYGSDEEMPVTSLKWRPNTAQFKTTNILASVQADGSLKHWHATSGKCLHARVDDPKNHLYTLDYSPDGNLLAAAGKDFRVRLYDETTKSLVCTMAERGNFPGHTNRVYCVKFN